MVRKKITALGLVLFLCGLLAACAVEIKVDLPESDGEAAWGNQIVVAYCPEDHSIKEMAEQIRNYAGAEIYVIEDKGNAEISLSEMENEMDAYKTLIIGIPMQNKPAQQEILDFLTSCDLQGKKVIPFMTEEEGAFGAESDIQTLQENMRKLCKDAALEECMVISQEEQIAPWLKQVGVFSELIQINHGNQVLYGGLYQNKEALAFAQLLPITEELYIPAAFARAFNLPVVLPNEDYRTRKYEIGKIAYWPEGPAVAVFVDDSEPRTVVPVIHLGQIFSEAENLAEEETISIKKLD